MEQLNLILATCTKESVDCISLVIDILSTIATVVAVIVAIVANRKATQSIKYSLKMQEQSKSVDLFDKRIAIIEEIKSNYTTSRLHLDLLFDEDISKEYANLLDCLTSLTQAKDDLDVYCDNLDAADGEGGFVSPVDELENAFEMLEKLEFPPDEVSAFEELCRNHEITFSVSGKKEDVKVYNYKDIIDAINYAQDKLGKQRKKLVKDMQEFVKKSISSLVDD